MFGLSPGELVVVVLVALLLFGAGRIADIGKGLGQGIRNFKQGLNEANEDEKDAKALPKGEKKESAEKA